MVERDPGDDLRADPPEDLAPDAAPAEARSGSRLRLVAFAAVGVALLAVVGWVGMSLLDRGQDEGGEVPLIAADTSPVKQRPEEPGGETVPNQDMLVYGTINPDQGAEVVERLLPPPEEPEPLPVEPAEPLVATPPAEAVEPGAAEAGEEPAATEAGGTAEAEGATVAEEGAAASDTGEEPDITSLLAESETDAATEAVPEATAAAEPEVPVPAAAPAGGWRVQIAAFKDRAQAESEWSRLAKRQADLLEGLPFAIEDVDLGPDKGIYHRLQVGAFADRGGADALCAQLKTRKVDCLVVKR